MNQFSITRRGFLSAAVAASASAIVLNGCAGFGTRQISSPELDAFIRAHMAKHDIVGVAAALTNRDRLIWSGTYGFADLERRIPISLDSVQNVASISKTFTTTALLQLWEQGRFQLDDDVSDYLPFRVRNPAHPDVAITFKHLLTHQSSIRDGDWYHRTYKCGDPSVSLADWVKGYLSPGGQFYDAAENFQPWSPGDRWDYNNLAYGLLGYLVEVISGQDFVDYSRRHIFEPLRLDQTAWYLSDIDLSRHLVPYTFVKGDQVRGPTWGGGALGVILEGSGSTVPVGDGHHANCAYNHPNFPDGFLRTSVKELAVVARAYLNGGSLNGQRILRPDTVEMMMKRQLDGGLGLQGLTWYSSADVRGRKVWGHSGGDPGVNTDFRLIPEEGIAAIAFTNTWGSRPNDITMRLLEAAATL